MAKTNKTKKSSVKKAPPERLNIRFGSDNLERVKYWAMRDGESANDWIIGAVEQRIARKNMDYDLPTLEQARLNQLVDGQKSLEIAINNLTQVVLKMSESITGLARGDNYLLGEEDGEL